jgi:FkbM family methyltransferase
VNTLDVAPPYCLVQSRHGWMLANVNDFYMGRAITTYGECNELEILFLLGLAQYPGGVVEVGANMGIHTIPMAQALQKQGRRLAAFEPQPVVFQQLCANLALNGLMNVSAWPFACEEKAGVVTFIQPNYLMTGNFGGVSTSLAPSIATTSAQAPCVRLDDTVQHDGVGLIKIDTEGFELNVLKGSDALIRRSRPLLYLENDRVDQSQELIEWLWGIGYDLWWHIPPLFNPNNFFGVKNNLYGVIHSFNMVGVPRELDLGIPTQLSKVADSRHHPLECAPRNLSTPGGKEVG